MSTHPHFTDDQIVSRTLAELRRRIRWYVAAEAAMAVLVFLGVAFWGGLFVDWMFEPSPDVRLAVHATIALVVAGILLWWGVRRWMVRLPDHSLALVLERRHPELAERLSTAVDLRARASKGEEVHAELAARTRQSAAAAAAELPIGEVLNRTRLRRFVAVAGGLGLSVAMLALTAPHVWKTYTDRIALSPDRWPRSVQLAIEGFEPDGEGGWIQKVARNADVPVVVNASLMDGLKAPGRVTIRYRWQDGDRGRDDLVRIGDAMPGRDPLQRYEYLFERIADSVEFSIRGGDHQLHRLRIEVVERPKVTELQFACQYPEYMGRADRSLTVGPRVDVPEGTRITIVGEANKPLQAITWQSTVLEDDKPLTHESTTGTFRTIAEVGRQDVELQISLRDEDGIESAEPFSVTIAAKQDQTPQVLVDREGIGLAVTPIARLPLRIRLEDDYAVREAWIEMRIGEQSAPPQPVALPPGGGNEVVTLATIDLRDLAQAASDADASLPVEPGQRMALTVAASDRYDLTDESRVGMGRAIALEIVTPEELVARLNGTEQNLRQTFEAIADKLLLLYDSLDRLDTPPTPTATLGSDADMLVVDTDAQEEPGASEELPSLGFQSARLAEDAQQIASEILAVAAGFEDVHAELENNRIDNSELAERIAVRIAAPLRKLGSERMPVVANRIAQVDGGDDALSDARNETRLAIADAEQVLREMQGLENYNEVIATLREIIRQQQRVHAKTKERQKDEVRDLLLD